MFLACARSPILPNSTVSQLVENQAQKNRSRESTTLINKELSNLWKVRTPKGSSISGPFAPEKLGAALRHLKPGKSLGLDSIFLEFILHARSALKSWFCNILTSCMCQLEIPKVWRRALIVAIPKPEKLLEDPKSYHNISLQCVPFKILERLIYAHVKPIINSLLLQEQAVFRYRRLTVDQDIKDSFLAKKKAGLLLSISQRPTTLYVIVASPASCYDCYLTDMFCMIMEMVGNHSFTLTTGNNKWSRLRHLKNSIP